MTTRRTVGRTATLLALFSSPITFLWLLQQGRSPLWAAVLTAIGIGFFRGILDLILRGVVDHPDMFADDSENARAEDSLYRRRTYFWSRKLRWVLIFISLVTLMWLVQGGSWAGHASWLIHLPLVLLQNKQLLLQMLIMPFFFLMNFAILFGPMMMMGASQMQAMEPGSADLGVKLEDVRGQKEAKEEIRKVITLWSAGARFAAAGGKRERGLLFLGAPGTGKTMLAKAIATGFNSPLLLMPGSGFAQTFIGMDAVIVRWLARRARKLASKWGGQCIVFIDEIDAVGMRRSSLGGQIKAQMPGGMMGGMGGMGLNQLLVVMDGIDSPPFFRKLITNKINLWLDVLYVVPQRIGRVPLRLPKAKPSGNQIYFVGATNVPLENLDPALTRPGRMGRHIHFRTPTKRDRLDIFDLYLGKVQHDPELDADGAREELARLTQGYSPAQIEQVCSVALTYAHHTGRDEFTRADVMEAMVTIEAGTALGWGYESADEEFSTAIHEAGHAVAAHIWKEGHESTRLSILRRGQTGGHHQAVELEERAFRDRRELFADLVWGLGSYAAEVAFFGHNTQGVGGDLQSTSWLAGTMVGRWGMPPYPVEAEHMTEVERKRIERRLEDLGTRLLAVAGMMDVKLPPAKYRAEAILVGQAYLAAWCTVVRNRDAIAMIARRLVDEKEIYGNDLVGLLDGAGLLAPAWDTYDPESWPPQ